MPSTTPIYNRGRLVSILIHHQRTDGICACGWAGYLAVRYANHIADVYEDQYGKTYPEVPA